jgi:pimeloyl-ACP methyl ester carboxylesterase
MIEAEAPSTLSIEEFPFFAPGRAGEIFGILTRPAGKEPTVSVVLLTGGGAPPSFNRNRLSTTLARRLAELGLATVRFDYHGMGESGGQTERFRLDQPFVDDVRAVVDTVRSVGVERVVLVGSCFGARTALAASNELDDVDAVALVAVPIRDFAMGERTITRLATQLTFWDAARRALRPRVLMRVLKSRRRRMYGRALISNVKRLIKSTRRDGNDPDGWVSPAFLDGCDALLSQRRRLLLLFGEGDDLWEEFEGAQTGRLGSMLRGAQDLVDTRSVPGSLHGFPTIDAQLWTSEVLVPWLTSFADEVRRDRAARCDDGRIG